MWGPEQCRVIAKVCGVSFLGGENFLNICCVSFKWVILVVCELYVSKDVNKKAI